MKFKFVMHHLQLTMIDDRSKQVVVDFLRIVVCLLLSRPFRKKRPLTKAQRRFIDEFACFLIFSMEYRAHRKNGEKLSTARRCQGRPNIPSHLTGGSQNLSCGTPVSSRESFCTGSNPGPWNPCSVPTHHATSSRPDKT